MALSAEPVKAEAVEWVKPSRKCPNCGRPPAWRFAKFARDAIQHLDPDTPVYSYQCHVSWCRTTYAISVGELSVHS